MIQNDDEYLFTINNDAIRRIALDMRLVSNGESLTDADCEAIACDMEARFDHMAASAVNHYCLVAARDEVRARDGRRITGVRVPASVDFQRWVHDYAVYVDCEEFDAGAVFDTYELSELPSRYDELDDVFDYGDEIFNRAVDLELVSDWDGPFYCRIISEESYDRYIARRVLLEHGYDIPEV